MPRAYGFVDYGGPETQRHLEVPLGVPGDGQVLVMVRAAGVNPIDWKVRNGNQRAFLRLRLPAVFGREVSGIVVRLGPGVRGLAVGDAVFGCTLGAAGGYAEYALAAAAELVRKPPEVSFTDAAALPIASATAYTAIRELQLHAGETLLVLGIGGGVGVAAAQLANRRGIEVVGTASAAKAHLIESLGATIVAYDRPDQRARLQDAMPDGAAGILDLVGGSTLDAIASLVSRKGRVFTVAGPETTARHGAYGVFRDQSAKVLASLAQLTASGRFDPQVRQVFSLDDAARALEAVETGHAFGKVVVAVRAS